MNSNQMNTYEIDDTDVPFKEDEYQRTLDDDIVLLNIVKEMGWN